MDGWEFALIRTAAGVNAADAAPIPREEDYQPVVLPHDWAVNAPFNREMEEGAQQGFRDRWGVGWYRRTVTVAEKKQNYCYYLDFGGIYEDSTVWVNDVEVGGRKYGYSPFRLDVTEAVRTGENRILVRVDNTKIPADRWYSGCGIYRTVKWMELEKAHLDEREIVIKTSLEERGGKNTARIAVDCCLDNLGINNNRYSVKISLYAPAGQATVAEAAADVCGKAELVIPNPLLWSAETPYLYGLEFTLLEDDRECDKLFVRFGIRDVKFIPNQGMFVNGIPVKLKGVCLHQEAGCRGIAAKKEIWRERLLHLKELGCNAIRAAHHVFSEEFMDLCDELGFYVYEECFDKWKGGLYGRYFMDNWQSDVAAMVKRDRNRPSVVIWGVGNEVENQAQESMLEILEMLRDYVRTMDLTRPVTYAMNPHFKRESNTDLSKIKDIQQFVDEVSDTEIYDNRERVERIRRIGRLVDIISCNYQEQWYPLIHEAIPDKLILGTEVYQYFCGHEEQMQNFTDDNPNLVPEKLDYCIGGMIWTGYDYLGESMGWPAKGWSGALIRTNNERRFSYYILQSYWKKREQEPMVHFSVLDYSLADEGVKEHWDMPIYADHWHFPQFRKTLIPYAIATNCEEAALYLNGKRFYVPKPAECKNNVITGFLPWQPGTVRAVGLIDGQEVCEHVTVTPKAAVQLRFDGADELHMPAPESGYEKLLTVRVADEEGNPCFRESGTVRFKVEGSARLIAVDNGNICSNEPYDEDSIHAYHGQASALIRLDGRPGRVKVSAWGEGLRAGELTISVGTVE